MGEGLGVVMALISSALGGSAAAVTRYLIADGDAILLANLRFGIGFLCVLPIAVALRATWPRARDWPVAAALGALFYGLAIVLYNVSLDYTTVARATLALSTLPFQTMIVGALLGREALTRRKTAGVLLAMAGIATALAGDLAQAPDGALRGELVMLATALIMSFYNVWSRPLIQHSSAFGFLAVSMGGGALVLLLAGAAAGSFTALGDFGPAEWAAAAYLGPGGGAAAFILWILALERASPTRVAITMTVNPLAAALLAVALLAEPITPIFLAGLATVALGIWLASTEPYRR